MRKSQKIFMDIFYGLIVALIFASSIAHFNAGSTVIGYITLFGSIGLALVWFYDEFVAGRRGNKYDDEDE